MPCTNESCAASEGLEICLFCGHSFCAHHRGEQDGLAACTGCLKAAHEQRAARKQKTQLAAAPSGTSSDSGPIQVQVAPPPPLPQAGPWVVPWAALATVPAVGYLYWFLGWLSRPERQDLPGWIQPVGTLLGGVFVFAAVWVIAKSRMSPER
jgi:hypothetical protein